MRRNIARWLRHLAAKLDQPPTVRVFLDRDEVTFIRRMEQAS